MTQPEMLDLIGTNRDATRIPETIDHQVFMVPPRAKKSEFLTSILTATEGRVLIFVNTKIAADELAHSMNNSDVAVSNGPSRLICSWSRRVRTHCLELSQTSCFFGANRSNWTKGSIWTAD